MQYLFMCCFDEKRWNALPQSERDNVIKDYGEFVQHAKATGNYLGGAKLQPSSVATTLRGRNGKAVVMDGPFAETKEQLGGLLVLEARDMNQAIQLMSQHPSIRMGGTWEVRPADHACLEYAKARSDRELQTSAAAK